MLISAIVFGPFIGAAAAAYIGKKNEKAGEYAALIVTLIILGLTITLARSAGTDPGALYPEAALLPPGAAEAALSPGAARGALSLVIPGILGGGDHVGGNNGFFPGILRPRKGAPGKIQILCSVHTGRRGRRHALG